MDDRSLEAYTQRQEFARARGMTDVVSVRLRVSEEHQHLLGAKESPECHTVFFTNPEEVPWAQLIEVIEEQYPIMEVRYLLPIGKIPLLLSPPPII